MDVPNSDPLRIDIVSDVVCPWCVIGWRQLERALHATGVAAVVDWHPFELNPQLGPQGQDLREHLAAKYGTTPEASRANRARIAELGADLGFAFAMSDDMRIRNTFRAHQLIHWAGLHGQAHAAKQALLAAYFSEGKDVNDLDVLVEVASGLGLDANEARVVLAEERYGAAVRDEEALWTGRGIDAVPAMIFAGKYLVSGAQGVDTYASILRQLISKKVDA